MRPHTRIRKTIKWGGAAVTVLLVVVWIGSEWVQVDWTKSYGFKLVLVSGTVGFVERWDSGIVPQLGWRFDSNTYGFGCSLLFKFRDDSHNIWVPLWVPLLVSTGVATAAWRPDIVAHRRKRADRLNLCPKCNYDRAGIGADAKCPECGAIPKGA